MNTVSEEHIDDVCVFRKGSIDFFFGGKSHASNPNCLFAEHEPKAPTITIFLRYPTELAECRDFYNPSCLLLLLGFLFHCIKLSLRLPAYLVPVYKVASLDHNQWRLLW